MSYAPESILKVRRLIQGIVPSLSSVELGIVGDDAHANSGTGYHLGKDALKSTAYSIVESPRDRRGLSNAASALDVGWFTIKAGGKTWTLRDFSKWLVSQCATGADDTLDIREVIYSPDGERVVRWDALKRRSTGDDSHLTHTHISWFRDSENRDKTAVFRRWFVHIGATEDDMALSAEDKTWLTREITRIVDARADAIAADVLSAFRFPWSADNPQDPASYQRNVADLIGDTWSAIMRGTTRGGQPLPANGALGRLLAGQGGSGPSLPTPEQTIEALRAELREILRDGAA